MKINVKMNPDLLHRIEHIVLEPGQSFLEELFGEDFTYNPDWFDKEKRP